VTRSEAEESDLDWHPGGRQLVFVRGRRGRHVRIKRLGTDGARRVTGGKGVASEPAWSPDGAVIVFERVSYGKRLSGLVELDPKRRTSRLILKAPVDDQGICDEPSLCSYTSPSWQPLP
jgi:Tol biopolymer transport system component